MGEEVVPLLHGLGGRIEGNLIFGDVGYTGTCDVASENNGLLRRDGFEGLRIGVGFDVGGELAKVLLGGVVADLAGV